MHKVARKRRRRTEKLDAKSQGFPARRGRAESCPTSVSLVQPAYAHPWCGGLSILRPIKGVDELLEENLRSSFEAVLVSAYSPALEIILCIAEKGDPAVALATALVEDYRGRVNAILLVEGQVLCESRVECSDPRERKISRPSDSSIPPVSLPSPTGSTPYLVNPKIKNLLPGYRMARYENVWILDANVTCAGLDSALDIIARDDRVGIVHHLPIYKLEQRSNCKPPVQRSWVSVHVEIAK